MSAKEQFEITIPGKLIKELNKQNLGSMLIFGCGESPLAELLSLCYQNVKITAYDVDKKKIQNRKSTNIIAYPNNIGEVNYVVEKPSQKFDAVIGLAVMHENPEEIADEIIGFMKQTGLVGIIDYDMKGISSEDFLLRWGHSVYERREKEKLGDELTHTLHTRFGLEDCIRIMQQRGINQLISEGNIRNNKFSKSLGHTKHFIYGGKINQQHNLS